MAIKIFDNKELDKLKEVLENQVLCRCEKNAFITKKFEDAIGNLFKKRYVYALNSGTSGNEAAVFGLGLEIGDEIICPATAPVFSSIPVFAAGCIPKFADVDPKTMIISPEGIEACVNEKTKAVVVVHLFGQAAPMDNILAVAKKHNLKIIEDCAQAFNVYYKGKQVGSFGDVTCGSLQQSKHMTSGEGGFVMSDDPEIYKRALLFSNAGMPYYSYGFEPEKSGLVNGIITRGHFTFGHNHRMGELCAAVALAQLDKLDQFNAIRKETVEMIENELKGCPGLLLAHRYPDTEANYWLYPVRLNPEETSLTVAEVSEICQKEEGEEIVPYHEVNYLEEVYRIANRDRRTPFGYPLPDNIQYKPGMCPNAENAAKRFFMFPVHHAIDREIIMAKTRALKKIMQKES